MNIRKAIDETYDFGIKKASYWKNPLSLDPSLSPSHIEAMKLVIENDLTMSDTKLCRWLGWMQAAIVAWGVATLDDMKEINKRNADV